MINLIGFVGYLKHTDRISYICSIVYKWIFKTKEVWMNKV